jgi:hypothetical protein
MLCPKYSLWHRQGGLLRRRTSNPEGERRGNSPQRHKEHEGKKSTNRVLARHHGTLSEPRTPNSEQWFLLKNLASLPNQGALLATPWESQATPLHA